MVDLKIDISCVDFGAWSVEILKVEVCSHRKSTALAFWPWKILENSILDQI